MKKSGFTLAEVLITLTIIGVIAAITLPSLTANVSKSQTGPALAKAINTLENANRMALQQYESINLSKVVEHIKATDGKYTDLLETQISGSVDSSNTSVYTSKDGISFIVTAGPTAMSSQGNLTNKYNYQYYNVLVDTNGYNKKPNENGEDRFEVIVDTAGAVIPSGGNEYKTYGLDTKVTECTALSYSEKCTGNIADNGWKVVY